MWDKWKKKLDNFIWKEVEEEDNYEYQPIQDLNPEIKTKIVYQYPNNDTYHIPQMQEQKREFSRQMVDMETPAYLRKGKRQSSPKQKEDYPVKVEVSDQKKSYEKLEVQDQKKPFERTEVPSPIYGFRKRNNKEVESVPTFLRKNQFNSVQIQKEIDEKDIAEVHSVFLKDTISNEDSISYIESDNFEPIYESVEFIDEKEDITLQSSSQDNVFQEQNEQQEELHKVEQPSTPISRTDTGKQRSVPFNVMMTPEDKRKLIERKRNQKEIASHSQKETVKMTHQSNITVNPDYANIPLHLLNDPVQKSNLNDQWISDQQQLLEQTLKHFHVRARVVNATQGPAVTRFEVHPELGVKVSKVKNLSDDLKLNMSAQDIRIEAPIPGKNTIGIEVPNPKSQMVSLQEILDTEAFESNSSLLTIALGLNIEGAPVVTNIQKMPHGLIAGATGSGKSVCINTILLSLIYKAHHEDVKFLLIDPKMVELAPYNGIPHLVAPVITDVKAATAALKWAVNEMEDRYERFVHEGVRDIERFNQRVINQGRENEKMPFIVIVIDELADLMMVSPQDVEDAISRIAQKARACGIHLLLATQRPSVDVLTGLIKANIPTRIAFSVSSQIDSRTIIDTGGAEKLLGRGDMLFVENGAGKSVRLQGPFVSDEEIERVTSYVRSIAEPNYLFEQESLLQQFVADEEEDELLEEAIQFIFNQNSASTSLLQRHFKIGYNRAARLMDALEYKGIISGQNGSKPRDVLITKSELEEILS